ncbi:MAG TPA: carbonic anhydrase [Pseudomonadales bacterium]|nr:carbonic anhydrase [Pseudomonadales bacterium]
MTQLIELIEGFKRFKKKFVEGKSDQYQALAQQGQSPKALIISCCDSRVDPALTLDCDPGDLFVVRNVANLVPPYNRERLYASTSAALEFGILSLNIEHIIIMGHSTCAGIKAVLEKARAHRRGKISETPASSVDQWMSNAITAAEETIEENDHIPEEDQHCICSRKSLVKSLENLKTYPWIKQGLENNSLTINGWYLHLSDASLERYCEEHQRFEYL